MISLSYHIMVRIPNLIILYYSISYILLIDNTNIKQETVYQQMPETVYNNVVNSWFPSIRIIRDEHWKDEKKECKGIIYMKMDLLVILYI